MPPVDLGYALSRPPGARIDQATVLWVLAALVAALVIYIISWSRSAKAIVDRPLEMRQVFG
jgi:hypothetical protein